MLHVLWGGVQPRGGESAGGGGGGQSEGGASQPCLATSHLPSPAPAAGMKCVLIPCLKWSDRV